MCIFYFTLTHFFKDIRCLLYNLLLLHLQTGTDLEVLIGPDIIIKNVCVWFCNMLFFNIIHLEFSIKSLPLRHL